jgi:nucleotide-binding universal stress UspA family protein
MRKESRTARALWRAMQNTLKTAGLVEVLVLFRKILIALDDGPISAHAADVGVALGRTLKSDLALIHVMAYPNTAFNADLGMMRSTQLLVSSEILDNEMEVGRKLLRGVRQRLSLEPSIPEYLECGEAAAEIIKVANSWSADLIVIGSHGRHGFDRLILGSVAESVTRSAPCPVLVIKAPT